MKNKWTWFTLLRWVLFVFITLVTGLIVIVAFQWYHRDLRDTTRLSDIGKIKNSLEAILVKGGGIPVPKNGQEINYKGGLLWTQWTFDESIGYDSFEDPLYGNKYTYSINNFRSEYELSSIYEWWNSFIGGKWSHRALVDGTYNGKFLKTSASWVDYILALPSITAANLSESDILSVLAQKNLVYNRKRNLPSSYSGLWYSMNGKLAYSNTKPVVFKGKFKSLKRWSEQLLFWVRLKKAYNGTFLQDNENFSELKQIDAKTNKQASVDVVVDYICNDVWWLWKAIWKIGGCE
jgi:hypothetical protein